MIVRNLPSLPHRRQFTQTGDQGLTAPRSAAVTLPEDRGREQTGTGCPPAWCCSGWSLSGPSSCTSAVCSHMSDLSPDPRQAGGRLSESAFTTASRVGTRRNGETDTDDAEGSSLSCRPSAAPQRIRIPSRFRMRVARLLGDPRALLRRAGISALRVAYRQPRLRSRDMACRKFAQTTRTRRAVADVRLSIPM